MYFKQIELTGFKSFADRTVFRLEPGVTAVVGPNGCGKSNLLDALRWCLGEQSAKALRGSHMQDVIFNGSEDRHAMGMAEVSVTFDNADSRLPLDFAEVQITRRLYRSGESEYLINRATCRLRDVQELFMDTGIGTHAYSLIGQGKIDLVLSSRPEDRRFLFEEAAGIIKYKSRKKTALRKLESAEQNLLRLGDIIAEVQRQMRSLKRQVNAAVRYRKISQQLRELEIRSAWMQYTRLMDEAAGLREQFAGAQDVYEKTAAETARLEARHEELGLAKLEVDRLLLARREAVHGIDTEMEKIEGQMALVRQQINFSKEQKGRALQEIEEFRQRVQAIEGQLSRTREHAKSLREEVGSCEKALESKQRERDAAAQRVADADGHLETMRARGVEAMNFRAKIQAEVETLGAAVANIDAQLQAIDDRHAEDDQRRDTLVGRTQEGQRVEAEQRAALAEAERENAETVAARETKAGELGSLNEQRQSAREKKSSLEARLHSLRELRDTYEGFAEGVRAVMRAKQDELAQVQGIIGPAGDLLTTERTYERAIEAALGGAINNVVVENTEAARAAIQFLKERSAGRVTFLPLDIVRVRGRDDQGKLQGRPGVIGPAIDRVEYDPHVSKAVEYLLHNTVIVETLDHATSIARAMDGYPRLVTLEGEVVSAAGAVTGGRTKHESRGLLGRTAEIAELEQEVQTAEAHVARLAQQGQALDDEIRALTLEVRRSEERQGVLRHKLSALGVESARLAAELDTLAQAAQNLDRQRGELAAKRGELEQRRDETLVRADTVVSDDEALQRQIAQAQEAASRARQDLSLCAGELADARVQLVSLTQTLEEAERNEQREQREHERAILEVERRVQLVAELEKNEAAFEQEIEQHLRRARALSQTKEEARKQVIGAENQRQALLDETEALDTDLRELRDRSRQAQSQMHQLEMNLRHDEDRIGFLQEQIQTEYHVVLSDLTEEEVGADEYDVASREQLVSELREKLERMGQVNLMAIEEYEVLEKRNAFLVSQEEDLRQAREALLSVVARIDTKIRGMFLETFKAVAESFHVYFRRLFNGGQARIYLLDEDDPLESGIEVEARPPGKRLQSISLLSGGESALTAIALLFSILKAKPSPFCVLDEVDAPLDDANIGRFLSLLEEFTDESQFVVITHNKQTMARASALYGVTMQERGVSLMVSARIEDVGDAENAA